MKSDIRVINILERCGWKDNLGPTEANVFEMEKEIEGQKYILYFIFDAEYNLLHLDVSVHNRLSVKMRFVEPKVDIEGDTIFIKDSTKEFKVIP